MGAKFSLYTVHVYDSMTFPAYEVACYIMFTTTLKAYSNSYMYSYFLKLILA